MDAFQKELNDIKGKLTGFDEKLVGFDEKLTGFDEMKSQLNTIVSILSRKGKEVATNEEEIVFDDDDHYEQPQGNVSGSKFILIPSKNTGEKGDIGSSKHDKSGEPEKQEEHKIEAMLEEKLEHMNERIRSIEGVESYEPMDASKLCLVPDVVIPHKFQMPEFERYNGTTCPKSHLVMYCNKMANHIRDERLMVHCFQNSLSGSALRWYMQLEKTKVRRWQDLADAFMRHYKHNQDLAPDREDLRNMEKNEKESFREYAQRWREKAADVQPPLSEKEMVSIFFGTLRAPYYNNMVGITTTNFADLLVIGERIEKGLKQGRMETPEASKKPHQARRGEADVHYAQTESSRGRRWDHQPQTNQAHPCVANAAIINQRPNFPTQRAIQSPTRVAPPPNNQNQNNYERFRKPIQIDPIPITYTELFPQLIQSNLISPIPCEPMKPPYPNWYKTDQHCAYHSGVAGHSTEDCRSLKIKVQQMINTGWLKFEDEPKRPDVNNNPLPTHGN
ncbi:unnamed protein product [Linum trigynum]|uniref:Retrotransposon gag domain-containing protein n=1 Tax=Linum trigynum TaxID=586398 RepID=A0AAV2GRT2_9ROSI